MASNFNFIHQDLRDNTSFLFGEFDQNDCVIFFDDTMQIEHCMAKAGLFPSASQARKNKWGGPIPSGFTFGRKFGKNKTIWMWNKVKYELLNDIIDPANNMIWQKGDKVYLADHGAMTDTHTPVTKNTLEDISVLVHNSALKKLF